MNSSTIPPLIEECRIENRECRTGKKIEKPRAYGDILHSLFCVRHSLFSRMWRYFLDDNAGAVCDGDIPGTSATVGRGHVLSCTITPLFPTK